MYPIQIIIAKRRLNMFMHMLQLLNTYGEFTYITCYSSVCRLQTLNELSYSVIYEWDCNPYVYDSA